MGSLAEHLLEEIPADGEFHAGIASAIERLCHDKTRLPSLAYELFPAVPFKRSGAITLPLWQDYKIAYVLFKSEYHGHKGSLVLIITENRMDALSVQLAREGHEIKIVEGGNFTVLDNRAGEIGSYGSIQPMLQALDRILATRVAHEP